MDAKTIGKNLLSRLEELSPYLDRFKLPKDKVELEKFSSKASMVALIVGFGYVTASVLSSVVMYMMVKNIMQGKTRTAVASVESAPSLPSVVAPNFRDLKKVIVDRNLFNSDGKVPDEKFEMEAMMRTASSFRLDGPCNKPTINVELMGTIYLGDPKTSFATVREKGYDEADIYKVGDQIIGNEGAFIAAVERQKLIVNNKGVKECFDLAKGEEAVNSAGGLGPSPDGFPVDASMGKDVTLESSYVESELGPGFGKIIDAARLVPNTVDNSMNGFKIFAIKPDSLLAKVGLQNGDVITQVNDDSLKLPEQGFAFFQALQDAKEIRLQILRNGTTPTSITIRIK